MKTLERLFKGIIVLAFLSIVTILFYVFIINKKDSLRTEIVQNDTLNQQAENKLIEGKLKELILQTSTKNQNIYSFYADTINYYDKGNLSKENVQKDKNEFFKYWDSIKIDISNLEVLKNDNETFTCLFEKNFICKTKNNSYNKGRVKSKIIFTKIQDNWKVSTEVDEVVIFSENSQSFKDYANNFIKNINSGLKFLKNNSTSTIITELEDSDRYVKSVNSDIYNWVKYTVENGKLSIDDSEYIIEATMEGGEITNFESYTNKLYFKKNNNSKFVLFKLISDG